MPSIWPQTPAIKIHPIDKLTTAIEIATNPIDKKPPRTKPNPAIPKTPQNPKKPHIIVRKTEIKM